MKQSGILLVTAMLSVILAAAAAFLVSGCADSGNMAPAPESPGQMCNGTIVVEYTRTPVTIDGKLDEAAWANAREVPLDWEKIWSRDQDGQRQSSLVKCPAPISWTKLLWDYDNLYFAGYCKDADLLATLEGRDADLWKDDAIELFIRPSTNSTRYWEYEWSPKNQLLDVAWGPAEDRDFDRNKQWNGTSESAVLVKGSLNKRDDVDEGWQIEARIPFTDFAAGAPNTGDAWTCFVLHYSKWLENDNPKKQIRTLQTGTSMLSKELDGYNRLLFKGGSRLQKYKKLLLQKYTRWSTKLKLSWH